MTVKDQRSATARVLPDEAAYMFEFSDPVPLEEGIEIVRRRRFDAADHVDYLVEPSRLKLTFTGGRLGLSFDGTSHGMRMTAWRQMRRLAGLRGRAPASCDALTRRAITTHLRSRAGRLRVRTVGGTVRAVLSSRFSPADDRDALCIVRDALARMGTLGQAEMRVARPGPQSLYRVTLRDTTFEVAPRDALQTGIDIVNSETGLAALSVSRLTYRLVCSNGLKAYVTTPEPAMRHVGGHQRLIDAVERSIERAVAATEAERELWRRAVISEAFQVDAVLAGLRTRGLSAALASRVGSAAAESGRSTATAFWLLNAVTHEAKAEGTLAARLNAERLAGLVLTDSAALEAMGSAALARA